MEACAPKSAQVIAGRFEIEGVLGSGGMGIVYRARDSQTGRSVALKRLRSERAGDQSALSALFEREFHTLSQLAHPCIIEVYDYGVDAEGAYYTMELLDGIDLREHGRLDWREACALLCDVASCLAVLHSRRLVHRDVSPRNIRRTSSGRAKLFDFGAMVPMGPTKQIVGTPACVPPEALMLQALDGRADLYSLGALAYWMLTGRYPYPARSLSQLFDVWSTPCKAPTELVADLPPRVSELVMQLLALDRNGRPTSAAEVMERLGAVAGLEPDRHRGSSLAYLTTPVLVGREAVVSLARKSLVAAREGRGTTLVVVGEAGSGRTRALDACVLEAKLAGATVLRADASDSSSGDWGVARMLARQLLQALPETANRALTLHRPFVAHVVDELAEPNETLPPARRRHLQAALRDWILSVARGNALFIAVDDVDRIDEPSAALLAAIAHGSEHRGVAIAVTRQSGADWDRPEHADSAKNPAGPSFFAPTNGEMLAIRLLDERGVRIGLSALSEQETESLVRSVFGDADQVLAVAQRIFETSQGRPRDVMELLHHLVQQGLARYEAGGWILPTRLADSDLPSSAASALAGRLAALDPDARALAEGLSVTDAEWLSLEDYPALSDQRDVRRVFGALSSLVSSGILVPEGERYRFLQQRWQALLEAQLSPERRRELHARLAEIAERRKDPVRRLHHLMSSGREALASCELLKAFEARGLEISSRILKLVERAVAATEHFAMPETTKLSLKLLAAGVASMISDYDAFIRHAPAARDRLLRDSGLLDWAELGDDVPAPERLQRALMRANERYEATPEPERAFSTFESMKRLGRLYSSFTGMSASAQDRELLANLPSLMPFAALSPAALVIQELVDGELALEEGRIERAREHFKAVRARISEPDGANVSHVYREQIRCSMIFIVAAIEARWGWASALELCDELDKVPRHRINAWRVRRAYYRLQGQIEEARRCQRTIELLELQDGPVPFQNASYRTELVACWLSDDLIGVKGFFEPLEEQARRFPRLAVLKQFAYCHYHRIRGEFQQALDALAPTFELALPLRHIDWQFVAATHIELLVLLGRQQEALAHADEALAICEREGLVNAARAIERVTVLALIAAGRLSEARERSERLIREQEADGVHGLVMMLCYSGRAHVAIAERDEAGFESWTGRCAEICEKSDSPAVKAQYERLREDARRAGMGSSVTPLAAEPAAPDDRVTTATAAKRLVECVDTQERARCALRVLLEDSGAQSGFLFGLRQGSLECIAAVPAVEPPAELRQRMENAWQGEFDATCATQVPLATASSNRDELTSSVQFQPVVLVARRAHDCIIAGVAAIAGGPEHRAPFSSELLQTIADALVEHSDVDPLTCFVELPSAS